MNQLLSLLLLAVIGMGPTPAIPVSETASSNEQGHTAVAALQPEIFVQTNRDHGTDECPAGNASTRRLVEIVIQDTDRAENYASGWPSSPAPCALPPSGGALVDTPAEDRTSFSPRALDGLLSPVERVPHRMGE